MTSSTHLFTYSYILTVQEFFMTIAKLLNFLTFSFFFSNLYQFFTFLSENVWLLVYFHFFEALKNGFEVLFSSGLH